MLAFNFVLFTFVMRFITTPTSTSFCSLVVRIRGPEGSNPSRRILMTNSLLHYPKCLKTEGQLQMNMMIDSSVLYLSSEPALSVEKLELLVVGTYSLMCAVHVRFAF